MKRNISVLISIYGFAAIKHMAKYSLKPLKIKENSSMKGKSFGGLPPPEPPRTVKGPPLCGGSRCYAAADAGWVNTS